MPGDLAEIFRSEQCACCRIVQHTSTSCSSRGMKLRPLMAEPAPALGGEMLAVAKAQSITDSPSRLMTQSGRGGMRLRAGPCSFSRKTVTLDGKAPDRCQQRGCQAIPRSGPQAECGLWLLSWGRPRHGRAAALRSAAHPSETATILGIPEGLKSSPCRKSICPFFSLSSIFT